MNGVLLVNKNTTHALPQSESWRGWDDSDVTIWKMTGSPTASLQSPTPHVKARNYKKKTTFTTVLEMQALNVNWIEGCTAVSLKEKQITFLPSP